ncbi:MAG: TonB-dependent receptor, partial [Alphaproteobacteria bacterium]|nr:TonB-dependent receptor [Alphaproteobacteria bacterium]
MKTHLLNRIVSSAFSICFMVGVMLGTSDAFAQKNVSLDDNLGKIHASRSILAADKKASDILRVADFDVTVSGVVRDQNGQPIPGATVSVPGTNLGTATDMDGKYSITVPEGSNLVFSFIGFDSQTITLGNQRILDITLMESVSSL